MHTHSSFCLHRFFSSSSFVRSFEWMISACKCIFVCVEMVNMWRRSDAHNDFRIFSSNNKLSLFLSHSDFSIVLNTLFFRLRFVHSIAHSHSFSASRCAFCESIGGCIVCLFCCRLPTDDDRRRCHCRLFWAVMSTFVSIIFFLSLYTSFCSTDEQQVLLALCRLRLLDFFYYYIQFCFSDYSSEWVWWLICCFCGNYNLIIWAFYTCYIEWERDIHITLSCDVCVSV